MKPFALAWLVSLMLLSASAAAQDTPATVRVDYYHGGNAGTEMFSLHQVVIEPLPWPGNLNKLIDTVGRGEYMFRVEQPDSGDVLYSRGFSSIFQEWQTTAEAKQMNRTFHESVRFPRPDHPVRLRILKRNKALGFDSIWTADIDTDDMLVVRAHAPALAESLHARDRDLPGLTAGYDAACCAAKRGTGLSSIGMWIAAAASPMAMATHQT